MDESTHIKRFDWREAFRSIHKGGNMNKILMSLAIIMWSGWGYTQDIVLSPTYVPEMTTDDGLYYLDKIQAADAWAITIGSKNVRIGFIDTGVNYNLPELRPNVDINTAEIPDNNIDDDHNGYIDDVFGVDTQSGRSNPMDFHGHGTFVAGMVGGIVNGLVKESSLVLAKALDEHGTGSIEATAKAIDYVVSRGSQIVVVTAGGGLQTQLACDAMERAKSKNVLFIVVSGNEGKDLDKEGQTIFPYSCTNDNKLVVAASKKDDTLAPYANFGVRSVHLVSPGEMISGFDNLGKPQTWSGTSWSAAIVAGVAGLALSVNPTLTYQELKEVIFYGTDPILSLKDKIKSSGRVNAYNAVRLARSIPRHP